MGDRFVDVPPLSEMRAMSDVELYELRTTLISQVFEVEGQLANREDPDEGWLRRTKYAAHVNRKGVSLAKNIIQERAMAHADALARTVPMEQWMRISIEVHTAVEAFLADDTDENFDALEKSYDRLRDFRTEAQIFWPEITKDHD